jgi:hypothetical protein
MSGAIHPLPQYTFMAWCLVKSTGTTLPLLYKSTFLDLTSQKLEVVYRNMEFLFAIPYAYIQSSLPKKQRIGSSSQRLAAIDVMPSGVAVCI